MGWPLISSIGLLPHENAHTIWPKKPKSTFLPKMFSFQNIKDYSIKKKKTTSLIKHIKLPGHQVLTAALWSGKEKLIERGPKPEALIIAEG